MLLMLRHADAGHGVGSVAASLDNFGFLEIAAMSNA